MKPPSVLLAAAILLIIPAAAEIIGVDQFDYPDGAVAGRNGGTFWNYKNTVPTGYSGAASTWFTLIATPQVTAGRLVTSGDAAAKREYRGATEAEGAVNDLNVAKKVFYRVSVTTGPTVTLADYFGISSMDFGTEKLYFGKRGGSATWGVEEVGVGGTNGGVTILRNTTYTLVVQVDFVNDFIRLFVNPDLNGPEPGSGSSFLVASRTYTGTNWSTAVRFAAGTAVTWDDLVVATTWEDLGTVVTTTTDEDNGFLGGGAGVSLREAVKYSPTGSLITFRDTLSGQTCTLSLGEMVIDKALTIDATALPGSFTLDGNHATRHFQVQPGRSLTLRGLTLTRGRASGTAPANAGGAIFANGSGSGNPVRLTLIACTLSGNSAQSGGAIYNSGNIAGNAILSLTACTFSGNSATDNGGAIFNDGILGSATASLTSCTFSGNSANFGGGIASAAASGSAAVNLHHTILAGNTAPNGPDLYEFSGTITTATGRNLMSSTAGTNLGANPLNITIAADPKLSPLGHFGGPVQTLHPLIGSPAIDAIVTTDPGGTDARGFPRFVNGDGDALTQLDIGAVEAGNVRTVTTAVDEDNGTGSLSLREALAVSTAPGDRIRFSPSLFSGTIFLGSQLTIPATANGLFIDASNLTTPATLSGQGTRRVFNIPATATVAMHSLRIENGKAADGQDGENGGGILNAGRLSLFSCAVSDNAAGNAAFSFDAGGSGGSGGGIFSTGPLSLTACALSGNAAGSGGRGSGGNGGGGGAGGGIFSSAPLTLTACTLFGNASGAGGGGSGNVGGNGGNGGSGGGIFSGGPLTLTACTLSGNSSGGGGGSFFSGGNGGSGGSGGGISKGDNAPYRITSCTIAGNQTGSGAAGSLSIGSAGAGGGISGGIVTLQNSLVSLNTQGPSTPSDVGVNSIAYIGTNLLGAAATAGSTSGLAPTISPTPHLAPLANYGGPTQTMALRPGSPARNAGSSTPRTTDQRGF
ncbi:MAG: choice-of-anchor Q domain-containing protein, partial [Luteolibacter sp.]